MEKEVDVKKGGNDGSKGFGVASFVLSLVGIVVLSFSPLVGIILGVLGLIFSIIQKKRMKTGLATAGFVISIIVIALGILQLIAMIFVWSSLASMMKNSESSSQKFDEMMEETELKLEQIDMTCSKDCSFVLKNVNFDKVDAVGSMSGKSIIISGNEQSITNRLEENNCEEIEFIFYEGENYIGKSAKCE
ncbi:MAG: DUF4190 domain-containing protein [archaeon]